MSKRTKIFVGLLSILPALLLVLYIFSFAGIFIATLDNSSQIHHPENGPPAFLMQGMVSMFTTMGLFVLSVIALLVYFLIHVINNEGIEPTERLIWVLVFLFAAPVGFPVYWYMRFWKVR